MKNTIADILKLGWVKLVLGILVGILISICFKLGYDAGKDAAKKDNQIEQLKK
jgi:hypothetical protein